MLARLCTTEQTSGETAPVAVGITNKGRPAPIHMLSWSLATMNAAITDFWYPAKFSNHAGLRKTHLQLLYRYPR